MSFAKVQSLSIASFVDSATKAFTASAVGNLLVVGCGTASTAAGGVPAISDTQGNTWTPILLTPKTLTGVGQMQGWWAQAKNTTASTITVSASNSGGFINILFDEFSGNLASGTVLDNSNSASSASGNPTVTVTPGADGYLLWAASNDGVTAVGAGFTKGGDDAQQDWSEYKVLGAGTSGVSQTANFTGSGGYLIIAATFKPAAGGGGGGTTQQTPQPAGYDGGINNGGRLNGGLA